MKIIELLNKIANEEEIPSKIKVDGKTYEYQGDDYGHKQDDDDNGIITSWLFTDNEIEKYDYISEFLNDEVEIIGEKKKINKLDKLEILDWEAFKIMTAGDKYELYQNIIIIMNVFIDCINNSFEDNDLINKINSLEKKQ